MVITTAQVAARRPPCGAAARVSRRRAGWLAVLALLTPWLPGCASGPLAVLDGADPAAWRDAAGRPFDRAALLARLRGARFLLLGEVHDNSAHHRLRAELLRALLADGVATRVVFEQLDRGHDVALADAAAAFRAGKGSVSGVGARTGVAGEAGVDGTGDAALTAGVEALVTAGRLDRAGWRWPLHRPLFAVALAGGAEIAGGNLSRADARSIGGGGATRLPADLRRWFDPARAEGRWSATQEARLNREVDDGHCRALPGSVLAPMMLGQRARDAALADALLQAVPPSAVDRAMRRVLLAGNGHVQADIGVPDYLRRAGVAAADIVTIGFLERDTTATSGEPSAASEPAVYDFVCSTAPVARTDPCAAFAVPPVKPR